MAPARTRPATPVAEPAKDDETSHSGRLLLRMPPVLHAELARAAQREGVSLNGYITGVLSSARESRPEPGTDRGSRLIRIAVVADLVLVAVAAAVAIALLIVAWP